MAASAIPRLMVAGTHSGVGKTTVALGVIRMLRRAGIAVQPFKVGPDYIDPGHLAAASGRSCRNLDGWLVPEAGIPRLFAKACRPGDWAVVEGVMGLHDGAGAVRDDGSSGRMAKLLQCPVLLVIDASAMSRSAAALVRGYAGLDPGVKIAGCFANRVAGPGHFRLVKEGIERLTGIPVLGWLPREAVLGMPERHLGLVPHQERAAGGVGEALDRRMRENLDLPRLLRIMRSAPSVQTAGGREAIARRKKKVPIAFALDEAFHFYYPDNLELLQELGAEMVPFSPLRSARLPAHARALYLGGGFPEIYAEPLARNTALQRQIRHIVRAGIPAYAECGGLMLLSRAITDSRGRRRPMAGVLPAEIRMTGKLQNFGYQEVRARAATVLSRPGERARGHEFHHSLMVRTPRSRAAYDVLPRQGGAGRLEGYAEGSLLASYIHLHFWNRPRWAERFVQAARRWEVSALTKGR